MRFSLIAVSSVIAAAYAAPAALGDIGVNGAIDSVSITDNTVDTGTVNAPVDVKGTISRVTGQITNNEVEALGARDVKTVVAQVKTTVIQVKTRITKIRGVITSTKTTVVSEKTKALKIVTDEVKSIAQSITLFLDGLRGTLPDAGKITDSEKKIISELINSLNSDITFTITSASIFGIGKSSQESILSFVLIARLDAFKITSLLNTIQLSTITILVPFLDNQDTKFFASVQGFISQIKLPIKVL